MTSWSATTIHSLHDTAQHTVIQKSHIMPDQHITLPSSFTQQPLMHPPTEKRPFAQAQQVIALFRDKMAGTHREQDPWKEFQLAPGEYTEIERLLSLDEELWGYVDDKVRHTTLYLPVENTSSNAESRHNPDAAFRHQDAKYPGVILECSYAQKRKAINLLAETYLLDSNASVRVVIGLDIGYGIEKKSEPTLSVWRPRISHTADGDELRAVKVVADEANQPIILVYNFAWLTSPVKSLHTVEELRKNGLK
ncbi:recQ family helicase [Pyrenophora seminiperda CCB06]|uniref:RecQ family helicase n=1 Tax=Pyrenophora seminiperda CCB06 TaxID=1302712 RepID=A0A3M7MF74_9PLEO|nr:recQ family helicase [Pyrenophora seminiperda CCB06]